MTPTAPEPAPRPGPGCLGARVARPEAADLTPLKTVSDA